MYLFGKTYATPETNQVFFHFFHSFMHRPFSQTFLFFNISLILSTSLAEAYLFTNFLWILFLNLPEFPNDEWLSRILSPVSCEFCFLNLPELLNDEWLSRTFSPISCEFCFKSPRVSSCFSHTFFYQFLAKFLFNFLIS